MIIDKRPIAFNYSKRVGSVKYIVVHDTGNMSEGAGALAHYKYFNGGDRQSSAHFFVDDHNIIETVEVALASWHCGDGHGAYGITNDNSIGIEICINPESNYIMAMAQARELIRFLMQTYSIPKSKVVRHYDASRKVCPRSMSANNWEQWKIFHGSI